MEGVNIFLSQTVTYGVVYILAALGVIIAGRSGIFNIAGEGIMLSTASVGYLVAYLTNNALMGFLAAAAVGALFGLLFIWLHETFKINQFILGICLILFGMGFSTLIYKIVIGVVLSPPSIPKLKDITIPVISKIPILSAFLTQDFVIYFAYISLIAAYWFYYRTKIGLETRAICESPKAADVVGINVVLRRYISTIVGAALVGVAGAYLTIGITGTFVPLITAGRGYMGVGLAIFCSWRPQRAILGGLLFALIEVSSYQLRLITDILPYQFFNALPFFLVLVVMVLFRKQVEFPASIGKEYSRE